MTAWLSLNRSTNKMVIIRRHLPSALLLLSLIGASIVWVRWDTAIEERATYNDISNLSNALAEHVGRTLREADQLATLVQLEVKNEHSPQALIDAFTKARAVDNETFQQIAIANQTGDITTSSIPNTKPTNILDREHFQIHKSSSDNQRLFISKPLVGRISGKWSIQVSKRLESKPGEFSGVVVLSIDPNYFTNLYKALEIGQKGTVNILGLEDNIIRARYSRLNSTAGQTLPSSAPLFSELRKSPKGTFHSVSRIDSVARHLAYRTVDGYPLLIVVGVDDDDVLAAIRLRTAVFLATVAALGALIVLLEAYRLRSMAQLERSAAKEQQSRRQQEAQANRLRNLFQTIPDGVLVVDGNCRIVKVNGSAQKLLGIQRLLLGATLSDVALWIFPEESAIGMQRREEFLRQISSFGKSATRSFNSCLGADYQRVLQFRASPPSDTEDTIIIVRDITSESKLDRMKSEFVSTAAHQLRTPLASLYGFSELLLYDKVPDTSKGMVYEAIHNQSKKLTLLLSDFLDLARIEARANNTADQKDCAISYLISKAIEHNSTISHRVTVAHSDGDALVHGDEKLLAQAIFNLIDNAAKYSPEDSMVSVKTHILPDKSSVCIEVSDVGIGMTPEQCTQAFDRFFRANPESSVPGTGLGLALVKEVAQMHDGRTSITSHIGIGTCVTLCLPIR